MTPTIKCLSSYFSARLVPSQVIAGLNYLYKDPSGRCVRACGEQAVELRRETGCLSWHCRRGGKRLSSCSPPSLV